MFLGFSVKVPIIPLHIWLPEAHVEAPTPGSVILAGLLLKLGFFAMLKLMIIPLNYLSTNFVFFVFIIGLIGLIFASLVALNHIDIKKLIAYSSVAHMNFSLIGLFSQCMLGIEGCFFLMIGHAITSGALFLGVGVLYDRYKTRLVFYYEEYPYLCLFSLFYTFFLFYRILAFLVLLISLVSFLYWLRVFLLVMLYYF